jgi:hypothetical protein
MQLQARWTDLNHVNGANLYMLHRAMRGLEADLEKEVDDHEDEGGGCIEYRCLRGFVSLACKKMTEANLPGSQGLTNNEPDDVTLAQVKVIAETAQKDILAILGPRGSRTP